MNGWYEDSSPTRTPPGARRDRARIGKPSAPLPNPAQEVAPGLGASWHWASENDAGTSRAATGRPGRTRHRCGPEVGDQLHHPMPGIGRTHGHGLELVGLARSDGVGSPPAVPWFSVREVVNPRPRPDRLAWPAAHARNVLRRRRFGRASRSPMT